MSANLLLFDDTPKRRKLTIEERFALWAKNNSSTIDLYLRFARQAKASGRKHYGMKAIAERVRWEMHVEKSEGEEFCVNNNYTAHIARLLVKLDPSLEGLFAFRNRKP